MKKTIEDLREDFKYQIQGVVQNSDNWKSFLDTACYTNKYEFSNQLLIHHAGRPVTAVAEFNIWNNVFHRRIKKGFKGIPIVRKVDDVSRIFYVFDVGDTYIDRNKDKGRSFELWSFDSAKHTGLVGYLDQESSTPLIEDKVDQYIRRNLDVESIVESLEVTRGGSFEVENRRMLEELLKVSVSYMMIRRMGLNADQYYLDNKKYFQEIQSISLLQGYSYPFLKEFCTNITLDYTKFSNEFSDEIKKSERNSLQEISPSRYAMGNEVEALERHVNVLTNDNKTTTEAEEDGELTSGGTRRIGILPGSGGSLHTSRKSGEIRKGGNGLPVGRGDRGVTSVGGTGRRGRGETDWDVRSDEGQVFVGDGRRASGYNVVGKDAEQSFGGRERGSRSETGSPYEADEEALWGDRRIEEERSNEMGSGSEQHQADGGRNRIRGNHIQGDDSSNDSRRFDKQKYEKTLDADSLDKEIEQLLLYGTGFQNGKLRTANFFEENLNRTERIEFVKSEYGSGGRSITGQNVWYGSKGFFFRVENERGDVVESSLSWAAVVDKVENLITRGVYLSEPEKESLSIQPGATNLTENGEEISVNEKEAFDLGFGRLGNGITVWNSNREVDNDYEILAHISEEGEVRYRRDDLPSDVKDKIVEMSERNQGLKKSRFTQVMSSEGKENRAAESDSIDVEAKEDAKINFEITDDVILGDGGPKEKYRKNILALQTLKTIEQENRFATKKEQKLLAKYVGWGGLPHAFDERKADWKNEYVELKELLTDKEYASARESTLNAHYTSPEIIQSMYQAIENMGFNTGNVLEPSVGVGNFFGMLPESMKNSRLYGVELDDVTGRIAKQLYQNANISVTGFENTNFPDNFFDVSIGNVPFGQYKVNDPKYNKENFLVHDYFFAKSLDQVRPGGVVAFITSKGTMDKEGENVRKYLGERADLLGAIRLPNTAFKDNAGTEVTSDILFLQKRESMSVAEPAWVKIGENEDGIRMNQYFIDNPHMVLGKMEIKTSQFGMESTCSPFPESNLREQLSIAVDHLKKVTIMPVVEKDEKGEGDIERVPADSSVRNFSFTVIDNHVYFRENAMMIKEVFEQKDELARVEALIEIRDLTRELIRYQTEDFTDEEIKGVQSRLNVAYDDFTEKHGRIHDVKNRKAFGKDAAYPLLEALEVVDEKGKFIEKAAMFSKRTIRRNLVVTEVDTAAEALTLSINEKSDVNLAYMSELTGRDEATLIEELKGTIYLNPETSMYETSDAYLSGNIREKLTRVNTEKERLETKLAALTSLYPVDEIEVEKVERRLTSMDENLVALEGVKPKDLTAGEVTTRLGATWIPEKDVQDFVYETLETPGYARYDIKVKLSEHTSVWNISKKTYDSGNVLATSTYGTSRINAYRIIEDSLNLKNVRIFDTEVDEQGNSIRVLNHKETTLAQQKQDALKERFSEWLWENPHRRKRLLKIYNERFNAIHPREYDGSHLTFPGMNIEIELKNHQKNAVAHSLYGGNTLMAHVVGAGKTYSCIASAMESKRLGLAQKSLIVVPNHLTEQWGADFINLYPSANVLVATKKDFTPKNRKRFVSRIATGEYDAVIIGHSQFEKIPLSEERQIKMIEEQIEEITNNLSVAREEVGQSFSVKELEKTKKSLDVRLQKLNDQTSKDDVIKFEELGIDRLYVDEAHSFKNLFLYTKMQNVSGIGNREAKKSSDMFMKCRYMDEVTGGKGVVFATGTPVSNSMTELYTMQRYLQYDALKEKGLEHFDSWASTFGEAVTAIELAPEGTGFRQKTRFAKFYNLPELMNMFKETADIQTADMLDLPVPEADLEVVVTKPSELQVEMVESLSIRADEVRNGSVDPRSDNMLKITNDGRKLALDQRLMNPNLPDSEESKVSICAKNVYSIWHDSIENKSTQLVFCDLSTPKADGSFNVYDDLKNKLMQSGIPEKEISFIHDAKTDKQKDVLFSKVRNGEIRVLVGSTEKMGAGTNVQDKLLAIHDLDCPWRPSDLEQRMGRIVRQGNENERVRVLRYVTENTFDSYSYQLIENKQKFISQIMTSKSPVRVADDVDDSTLSYAEIKALATGNPLIKEKMDLDMQVSRLRMLKSSFMQEKHILEDRVLTYYPKAINSLNHTINAISDDIEHVSKETKILSGNNFSPMTVQGIQYLTKEDAGSALLAEIRNAKEKQSEIGEYRGFKMFASFDPFKRDFVLILKNKHSYEVAIGDNQVGSITRIDNVIQSLPKRLEDGKEELTVTKKQLEDAKKEAVKPFPYEDDLARKMEDLAFVEKELDPTFECENNSDNGKEVESEKQKAVVHER